MYAGEDGRDPACEGWPLRSLRDNVDFQCHSVQTSFATRHAFRTTKESVVSRDQRIPQRVLAVQYITENGLSTAIAFIGYIEYSIYVFLQLLSFRDPVSPHDLKQPPYPLPRSIPRHCIQSKFEITNPT